MSNDTTPTSERPVVYADRPEGAPPVVERDYVERDVVEHDDRPGRVGPFIAGVLATVAAFAIGIAVFLVVSDSDDDGNIELNVPSVDVDVNE